MGRKWGCFEEAPVCVTLVLPDPVGPTNMRPWRTTVVSNNWIHLLMKPANKEERYENYMAWLNHNMSWYNHTQVSLVNDITCELICKLVHIIVHICMQSCDSWVYKFILVHHSIALSLSVTLQLIPYSLPSDQV